MLRRGRHTSNSLGSSYIYKRHRTFGKKCLSPLVLVDPSRYNPNGMNKIDWTTAWLIGGVLAFVPLAWLQVPKIGTNHAVTYWIFLSYLFLLTAACSYCTPISMDRFRGTWWTLLAPGVGMAIVVYLGLRPVENWLFAITIEVGSRNRPPIYSTAYALGLGALVPGGMMRQWWPRFGKNVTTVVSTKS